VNVRELMQVGPVIPVIVIDDIADAVPLAKALIAGGVRVLEITLRTPVGMAAVKAIASEVPDAIVGVGTITRSEEFAQSLDAGAQFAVTPGLTPALVEAARKLPLPLLPGVMTPTEVIAAKSAGFMELKLFPAQQAGGVGMLKALSGPFPDVTFCPTGGINAATAPEFLALPNVACVGGSWLTPKDAIADGDWRKITELARETETLRALAALRF
jgi:2-dehydro-3-deoxyphosphogluconate aldolase/(4S)-4-hydroxy-2-oxoglutarate aldolase